MTEYANEEYTIDLYDFCGKLLSKWKQVLVCMLVGAIVFAAGSYVKSYRDVRAQANAATPDEINHFTSITEQEGKTLLESAFSYRKMIAEMQNYLNESVLMQLPDGIATTYNMQYNLDSLTGEPLSREAQEYIVWAYSRMVQSDAICQRISDALAPEYDVQPSYVSELIKISSQAYDAPAIVNEQEAEPADTPRVLAVAITGYDEAFCETIAQILDQEIRDNVPAIMQPAEYAVVLDSSYVNTQVQTNLTDTRNRNVQNITQYTTALTNLTSKLTAEEKTYVNNELDGIEQEIAMAKPQVSRKMTLIGALLGAFAICALYACLYLFSSNVHTVDALECEFGQKVLGTVVDTKGEKKPINVLDKLIHRKATSLPKETAVELIKQQICIKAKNENIQTVAVSCIADSSSADSLRDELVAALAKTELRPISIGKILNEPEALAAAAKADALVFIEEIENTNARELRKVITQCQDQKMIVLGSAVLE